MIAHATLAEPTTMTDNDSTTTVSSPPLQPMPSAKAAPAPKLVVSRAAAAEGLRAVVQRGMEIRKWGIYDFADLETVRAAKQTWTQAYTDLLNTIFDSGAVADECNDWVGTILPEYADVALFAEQLYKEMSHRLKRLRAVLKRIPTTDEPGAPEPGAAAPLNGAAAHTPPAPAPVAPKPAAPRVVAAPAPVRPPVVKSVAAKAPAVAPRVVAPRVVVPPAEAEPFDVLPLKPAVAPVAERTAAPVVVNEVTSRPPTPPAAAPVASPPPVATVRTVPADAQPAPAAAQPSAPQAPASILLAHAGRDATKENVVEFLCDLGVEVVEWDHAPKPPPATASVDADEEPAPPPAPLMEQFEQVIADLGGVARQPRFALVLLDAHAAAGLQPGSADPLCGCPRDLLFRLGLLTGLFGRQLCVLYPGGPNAPSFRDAQGTSFLAVGTTEGWQLQLARHLKRAGLDVDLNRLC